MSGEHIILKHWREFQPSLVKELHQERATCNGSSTTSRSW